MTNAINGVAEFAGKAAHYCGSRSVMPIRITREQNHHEWGMWRGYFRARGMMFSYSEMGKPVTKSWTVPAALPDDFEPGYVGLPSPVMDGGKNGRT